MHGDDNSYCDSGIERIRFATSHPRYFTERLIKACAELPKLCEFFHIPFQSGDDDILREMARGYTAARYADIIYSIRRHMPDASVSGDAIVGFPGMHRGRCVCMTCTTRMICHFFATT